MALPASPVDICNLALDLLGERPITNITNPVTDTEYLLSRNYDAVRRATLRKYNWHFAKQGALVSLIGSTATSPITGNPPAPSNATTSYDYSDSYLLPNDLVRFLSWQGSAEKFQDKHYDIRNDSTGEGRILTVNNGGTSTVNIRYIQDIQNVALWDDCFRQLLCIDLALSIGYQITKDKNIIRQIQIMREDVVKDAIAVNGQERPPIRIERSKTLGARRRASTDWGQGYWGESGWCDGPIFPPPSTPPTGTINTFSLISDVAPLIFFGNPPPLAATVTMTLNAQGNAGAIMYFSALNTLSTFNIGTNGQVLISNGGTLQWAGPGAGLGTVTSVGLSMPGTSTIFTITNSPVVNAGTLTATVTATAGDLIYASGTNVLGRLPIGTTNYVLTSTGTAPSWTVNNAVTSVGLSMPGDFSVANSPVTSTGTLTVTRTTQSAVNVLGGSALQGAAAATPTYKPYDKSAWMGGWSGLRALPTTGAISGDYYNNGNWTQTGAITSTNVRVFNSGTMTINAAWTIATETSGGTGSGGSSVILPGARGGGLGGGNGGAGISGTFASAGGGGGFGGGGGAGACNIASVAVTNGGGTYPISANLSGSGGGGGSGSVQGTTGGAGGGSLYIESTGAITFTAAAVMTASGAAGTGSSTSNVVCGGGGSGGGIQIRCVSTVTINASGSITAAGGAGGTNSAAGGYGGGGGGGGIIDISGSTVTNSGTVTAAAGAAGTSGSGISTAALGGGAGIVNLNSFVQGPRSSG